MSKKTLSITLALVMALGLFCLTVSAETRIWTAKTGHTIDGEFVRLEDGTVTIQLPNGSTARIPLDQLSDDDQKFVDLQIRKKLGFNTPRDVLEQETEKGNLEALYYLAGCSAEGWNGCPKDEKKANKLYQRGSQSADTGNPFAQYCRALCYLEGIGVDKDETEAVKWLRKAAEQGNAPAQYHLGVCYSKGDGVPEDETEAVKWNLKSAVQGFPPAQSDIGARYERGDGVPRDREEAVKWYRLAAEQGFPPALYNLGVCYLFGMGVPQDKEEGVKWLRLAAERGDSWAKNLLRELESNGGTKPPTPEPKPTPAPQPPPDSGMDAKLVGHWCDDRLASSVNYEWIFQEDGSFQYVYTWGANQASPGGKSHAAGQYTVSNGKIYLMDIIYEAGTEFERKYDNCVYEYEIDTDHVGVSLKMPYFRYDAAYVDMSQGITFRRNHTGTGDGTTPTPEPPGGGIDPKLSANYWTCSFMSSGGASNTDMANYFFYKDGIFVYDYWRGYVQLKYVGKYSVSNGEIHFTNIKEYHQKNDENPFYGNAGRIDTYTFYADKPDRTLPYVFVTDDQGESLRIGRIDAAIPSPSPLQFRKLSLKTGDGENNTQGGMTTPTPTPQPPGGNIDPKILGSWGYYIQNSTYVYQFKADGTFSQVKVWGGSATRIDGKFTTSGGTVYLTDLVLSYYDDGEKKKPLKNKSSAYKFGTNAQYNKDYLEIRIFSASDTVPDSEGLSKFSK